MEEIYFANFTKLAHDNLTESVQNNFHEVKIIQSLGVSPSNNERAQTEKVQTFQF